jgi:hypothetical protein
MGGAGMGGAGMSGAGTGGSGGVAPSCTGAGICGRSTDGIHCARSNGSNALVSYAHWNANGNFGDPEGWTVLHFWAGIQFPDINGDGRADICGRAAAGIACALATNAASFTTSTIWLSEFSDAQGWYLFYGYWATIQYPDVNGDGYADVCGRAPDGIICALSNGVNAFSSSTRWTTSFSDAAGWSANATYYETIRFPDINGDGRADVCGRSTAGIVCGLSTGSAFGSVVSWNTDFSDTGGWNVTPSYWKTIQFPDVNGDGAADVCGRGAGGVVCGLSNGASGFGTTSAWGPGFSDGDGWNSNQSFWGTLQYPDVNGDGRADLCGRVNDGVNCALSSGTAFGIPMLWTTAFSNAAGYLTDSTRWATIQYPDLDANGRADICGRSPSGMICGLSSGSSFATSLWTDRFGDADGWQSNQYYGLTVSSPNQNVPGCAPVTKRSTYQTPTERLGPL